MSNGEQKNYKELAEEFHTGLRAWLDSPSTTDLITNPNEVGALTLLEWNLRRSLNDVVYGLRQDNHRARAGRLEEAIANARQAVVDFKNGNILPALLVESVLPITSELQPVRCQAVPQKSAGKGQEVNLQIKRKPLIPTIKNIDEIIKKVRILKKKQTDFINAKGQVPDNNVSERAEKLDAIGKPKQKGGTKDSVANLLKNIKSLEVLRIQREGAWPEDIQHLISEIIAMLYTYWDYFEANDLWEIKKHASIEYLIKHGKASDLDNVIQGLKNIKHKMEIEAKQARNTDLEYINKKPEETGQGKKETKIKEKSRMKKSKNGEKTERGVLMMSERLSKENWEAIKSEYGISKRDFGKKINFVSDSFKKKIIFRDAELAFVLATHGFSKPALILAGGVIEELLRLYLEYKKIKPKDKNFVSYIKACEDNKLLKRGVSRLTDSVRDFRNLVHLSNEKTSRDTILKPAAKGAVASIFTIANDFQKVLSN